MWDGVFAKRSVTEHFDIINIRREELTDVYFVTVEFYNYRQKQYVFEIPGERFSADKESIGKEIINQLKS